MAGAFRRRKGRHRSRLPEHVAHVLPIILRRRSGGHPGESSGVRRFSARRAVAVDGVPRGRSALRAARGRAEDPAGPNLPVLFERVRGTSFPVISNTLGNYGIIARLLGANATCVAARWAELTASTAEPAALEHASPPDDFQEVSLADLPHVVYCEKDAGPYLTASVVVAQDPDTEVVNLSYHRMQMVSAKELRCRLSPSGDLFRIHQKPPTISRFLACGRGPLPAWAARSAARFLTTARCPPAPGWRGRVPAAPRRS